MCIITHIILLHVSGGCKVVNNVSLTHTRMCIITNTLQREVLLLPRGESELHIIYTICANLDRHCQSQPITHYIFRHLTVGDNKNCTLRFSWISQPKMHQFKKSLCPSSRGGPEDSKTPPTFKVCMILSHVMEHPKKQCFDFPSLNLQSKLFWETFIFFILP